MPRKKKILWVGEASFLNTGFAVYSKELLSRLHATGKYTIAELGIYGGVNDPRRFDIPWTYYGNMPATPEEEQVYARDMTAQWGAQHFEEVLLDFKPDIVADCRDWWMLEFVERSPLRRCFHWVIMPTIDSAPQREQWNSTYLNADAVLAYSEFGRDTMLKETGGSVKFVGLAPPAADYEVWTPSPNRKQLREFMGLEQDINIVGTVMRNQKRKLYPELILAFKSFMEQHPALGKKTFLYCHTAFPDVGWDIPLLVKESGIGHKILFTYHCKECGYVFPSFFQDAVQCCPRCKKLAARLPTSDNGITNKQLADVVNTFDVYVQYSICEGFGMPQVEAAACGIPVMAVNYSAMESVVKNLKGIPIDVGTFFRECETHAYRAYPDSKDFIAKLARFLNKSEDQRLELSRTVYRNCRQHYSWDQTAKVWEKAIDSLPVLSPEQTWRSQPRLGNPTAVPPEGLSNESFVRWCVANIWGELEKINSYVVLRMIRDLNYGHAPSAGNIFYDEESAVNSVSKFTPFTRETILNTVRNLASMKNISEQRRLGVMPISQSPHIALAKKEVQV